MRFTKETIEENHLSNASFIEMEESHTAHNYHPLPVVLERGEGVFLWDVEGKGLSKIEDLSIAQAILRKTQAMNFSIAQKAIGITLALGLLPEIIYRLK